MWPFETAKAISAAIRVLNSYSSAHMSQEKLWAMMWQYAASHTPLWKVINTTNGEFCNLDDPHSDLKSWLLPGTQNSWIAVCMLLYRWLYRAVYNRLILHRVRAGVRLCGHKRYGASSLD